VAIIYHQLGDFEAAFARFVAKAAHDQTGPHSSLSLTLLQSFVNRVEYFLHIEAVAKVELGREADFAVNCAVSSEVFDNLARNANEMVTVLHDFERKIDADEIVGEVDADFRRNQCWLQWGWKRETDLAAEVGDRGNADGRVEVAVKFDFWERFKVDGHSAAPRRSDINYGTGVLLRER
jgi:hypothetical protein